MNKVMIGVPTAGYSRNDHFYDYYNMLDKPEGTICTFARGQSPARNRNLIISLALKNECTHILFLDDDIAFKPSILKDLIKHDKDIVTALYLMRSYPHQPIIFDFSDSEGRCSHHYPQEGEKGLIPIINCGLGCCLIKVEVFRALDEPWIRLGELEKDHWCDDIGFFNRARESGFSLYCDLDCMVGHMCNSIVWPNKVEDKWYVVYDTNGSGQVTFPALVPVGV